jgi:hypothetical protein
MACIEECFIFVILSYLIRTDQNQSQLCTYFIIYKLHSFCAILTISIWFVIVLLFLEASALLNITIFLILRVYAIKKLFFIRRKSKIYCNYKKVKWDYNDNFLCEVSTTFLTLPCEYSLMTIEQAYLASAAWDVWCPTLLEDLKRSACACLMIAP